MCPQTLFRLQHEAAARWSLASVCPWRGGSWAKHNCSDRTRTFLNPKARSWETPRKEVLGFSSGHLVFQHRGLPVCEWNGGTAAPCSVQALLLRPQCFPDIFDIRGSRKQLQMNKLWKHWCCLSAGLASPYSWGSKRSFLNRSNSDRVKYSKGIFRCLRQRHQSFPPWSSMMNWERWLLNFI